MVFRDSNCKFNIVTLIYLSIYVQAEKCCVTCYFSLTFLFLVSYFIYSLFKRKGLQKLTQVSIIISKMSYFSFTFTLNGKKKVLFKSMIWRGGVTRKYFWRGGGLFLIELLEIFQKEALRTPGGFDKKRWRKNRIRGVMVRKETM